MVLFATGGGIRASFVETRRLAILAAPIESAGVLYFAPPDRLARHTSRPGRSRVVVHGDRVAFRDETGSQTLDLGSSGAARTLIGGLMVLLRGDLAALRERYRVAFRVTGREWELDLEPRDRAARALVERTLVRGKDAELTSMETRETSGDATITEFRDVDTGIAFEDAELERIFSLRWPDEES